VFVENDSLFTLGCTFNAGITVLAVYLFNQQVYPIPESHECGSKSTSTMGRRI